MVRAGLLVLGFALAGCQSAPPECVGVNCLPGPPCSADAECDDGLVCNGVERCGTVSQRCVAGVAIDCDDGIECTVDQCLEPDASCGSRPSDGRCGGRDSCDAEFGCLPACDDGVTCDPVLSCGCRPGEACRYSPTGEPACGPAGAVAHGERCTESTVCAAGTQCLGLDTFAPARYGECRTLCHSDTDCVDGGRCKLRLGAADTFACTQPCDLVESICPPPTACALLGSADDAFTDCLVAGSIPRGSSCETGECEAGTICIRFDVGPVCVSFCRRGGSDCASSELCYELDPLLIVDGERFGVCFEGNPLG